MMRSILVAVGAAVLSWVWLSLSVVAWLSWTSSGHFVRGPEVMHKDSATVQKEYRDPFKLLERAKTGYQLGVIPVISIITGVAVGLTTKVRAGWIAVIALLSLQIFLLVADSFTIGAFLRALVYCLLVYFCASKLRSMRANSPPKAAPTPA
jgi:hypothetical protein